MNLVLERFPGFRARWQVHVTWWEGEEAGLCNDISEFGRYVKHLIAAGEAGTLPEVFAFIEELMDQGDNEVQDAIATCCLENLLNYSSGGSIAPESFVHLLGSKSREYCRTWDEFTGVRTPGL
jgi:hypothetical protein